VDEHQAAPVEQERWNLFAIVGAIAGLAASFCCLGFLVAFYSTDNPNPFHFVFWMVFFALVAFVALGAGFGSGRRRGSLFFGTVGGVSGLGIPFVFGWWLLSRMMRA
jgi:predicted lysophospholipase L1 biosynthesis ABC-type transport system permease subunit